MRRVGFCALALLVAFAAGVASFSMPTEAGAGVARVLKTVGPVVDLAADGRRLAVAVAATHRTCDRIAVWSPLARRVWTWSARTSCPPGDQTSGGEFLREVGLAEARVAWVEVFQGNLQDLVLRTATLSRPRPVQAAFAANHVGASESPEGDHLGNLHGDRSLLAYGTWSVCIAYPQGWEVEVPPQPPCEAPAGGAEPREVTFGEELRALGRAQPIATGADANPIVDVQAGTVAVLRPGRVVLHSLSGAVSVVSVPPGTTGAALSGRDVVVLHGSTVEVVGGAAHTLPLSAGATALLADVHAGIAALLDGRRLVLLDLARGSRRVVTVPGHGRVDAALDAAGLFYGYSVRSGRSRGRVAFVPLATVQDWLG